MTILFFRDISEADASRVGGKAFSLGRMAAAGLPVPDGFVLTTDAYRNFAQAPLQPASEFVRQVVAAYDRLGGGLVAVRSSATAEDSAETSFAGQQETILGVEGEPKLLEAIERCWKSLHSERAIAYRARQGVDDSLVAMAVVVQKLIPAEVAGVLFTRDPQDPSGKRMLAEASWGLGESVVSGRVSPDRFELDRETGEVLSRSLGSKLLQVTAAGEEPIPPELQASYCLSDTALSQLAELGRRVEAYSEDARDIEWAFASGTFHLLQARPITVASAAEREAIRAAAIQTLRSHAEPGGTVWVKFNLSEVLPQPTPMTWSIVQRLLAADGGFGAMNRDLGSTPDPSLGSQSAFDLVAGRPMMNLSRLPRMQFANPPIEYPIAAYRADPKLALNPKPNLNPLRGGTLRGLLRLPGTIWRLSRIMNRTKQEAGRFAEAFRKEVVPAFLGELQAAQAKPLHDSNSDLLAILNHWIERTLIQFARQSLKPTVFADYYWNALIETLKPRLGLERSEAAVRELSLGARAQESEDYAAGVHAYAASRLTREEFLAGFGHRCTNEMELSQPRWSEDAEAVERLRGVTAGHGSFTESAHGEVIQRIRTEAKLGGPAYDQFLQHIERLRLYLGLREAAKHYLLMGYAFIRRILVELDRLLGLHGGLFFLTLGDLPELLAGADLSARMASARKRRQAELSLEVPPVLFSDDLEAIGRPLPLPVGGDTLNGIPLSSGAADGPALVLTEPTAAPPEGGYVLVCPSTDPAWVPLFAKAKALVMETGGVLSHGAIVAREFGLPAVAGLPGITDQLKTGQRLHVDGGRGTVTITGGTI